MHNELLEQFWIPNNSRLSVEASDHTLMCFEDLEKADWIVEATEDEWVCFWERYDTGSSVNKARRDYAKLLDNVMKIRYSGIHLSDYYRPSLHKDLLFDQNLFGNRGLNYVIGRLVGDPVCISWANCGVNGLRVIYWNMPSNVCVYSKAEEFLKDYCPAYSDFRKCNAANLHQLVQYASAYDKNHIGKDA